MKLNIILYTSLLLMCFNASWAQDDQDILAYIEQYKSLAIDEHIRTGVPAAITLAQGIHESASGKSELATKGNNHFGIKCKTSWMGETILHDDDKKQECFRKYASVIQSYIDHSDFLKGSNRYHFLFDLERTDYAGWASGLKRAGYATNPNYVKRLTELVEKYNLQQYTYEAISKSNTTIGEVIPNDDKPRNLTHVDDPMTYYKGLKGFWANKGETLLPKALEKNIRYVKLLSLNDLADEPLKTDMFIFVEKKRKFGTEEFHIVNEDETMLLIAQKEAMLLSNLYAFNNLVPGQEPMPGQKLHLQYKSYETPKIKEQFLSELQVPSSPAIAKVETQSKEVVKPIQEEIITTKEEPIVILEEKKEAEVIKNDEPVAIESSPSVVEENKTDIPQTASIINAPIQTESTNEEIIDREKAKRMEALLNSKPLNETQSEIIIAEPRDASTMVRKEEPRRVEKKEEVVASTTLVPVIEEVKIEEVIAAKIDEPIIAAEPQPAIVVKRKYDEQGVDDSVKILKRKFDPIVYAPRPVKKVDTPKKVEPITPRQIAEIKKTDAINKIEEKKITTTKKPETKAVKKEVVKKDDAKKKEEVKRKEDPKKKVENKKEDIKKVNTKANNRKEIAKDKKDGPSKKTNVKDKKEVDDKKGSATTKKNSNKKKEPVKKK